jgi:hypothetical protein
MAVFLTLDHKRPNKPVPYLYHWLNNCPSMKYNTACRWLAIFIFSIWYCSLAAQTVPGYCITATGDSLTGMCNMEESTAQLLFFQPSGSDKWIRYQPKEIKKSVLENGVIHLSHKIPFRGDTSFVFLYSLVTGHYNLFQTQTSSEGILYFLNSVQNPQLIKVNQKALETQFSAYFGDCAKGPKPKLRYAESNLVDFVSVMNKCIDPAFVEQSVHSKKIRVEAGLGATAFVYRYKGTVADEFNDRSKINFPAQIKPSAGIFGQVRVGKSLVFRAGANFIYTPLKTDTVVVVFDQGSSGSVIYKINSHEDFRLKYIEFPVGLTFNLLQFRKITPVLGGGGMLVHASGTEGTDGFLSRGVKRDNSIDRQKENFYGWYLQAGIKYALRDHRDVEFWVSYHGTKRNNKIILADDNTYPTRLVVRADRIQIGLAFSFFQESKNIPK